MTQNVGDIEYVIKADTAQLLRADKQVVNVTNSMESGFKKADKSADALNTGLTKLASTLKLVIAAGTLREMARMVQSYQEMAERVQMATSSQDEFERVQKRLLNTANGTYRSLAEAQELYIRSADGLRSMGYSTEQAIDVQDSMSYAFVKNAASAERADSAISAFTKAINTGTVSADQWESITTAIPTVINDIATASGKSAAAVRALGASGKLTASDLTEGLRQSLEANTAAAAGMSNNLVDASVRMRTAVTSMLVAVEGQAGVIQSFTNSIIAAADTILSFSENSEAMKGYIDSATLAAKAFALVMAGRYAGSLKDAVSGKLQSVAATRQQTAAENQSAQSLLIAANAAQRKTLADKEAAFSAVALAQAELNVARGSSAEMTALENLNAAKSRARAASLALVEAETAQAAATARAAAAARAASVGFGLARGALSLIGGPAGVAMIAASALLYWWQTAKQAKEEAVAFADGLDKLISSMKTMSNTQLRGAIADANIAMKGLKATIADSTDEIEDLTAKRDDYIKKGSQFNTTAEQGNGLLQKAAELTNLINQKERDRAENQDRLTRTAQARDSMETTLNNNMLTSMGVHDRLIEKGSTLELVQGAVARAFGKTADEINRANQAGQNFNPKSLQIAPPTADGDKLILNLEEQNELLKIQDERQRAVAKARMAASKVTDNPNQIASAERLAAENYDLQEAEEARRKAQQQSEQQGKSAATQMEANAQKIADYKQRAETATGATQDLSREQAMLRAEQSLNKSATAGQIDEIRKYAAAEWDAANAVKMRQQAEQGKKFAQQEIVANVTTPDAVTGAVQNPTALIDLQEQQKLAALAKYQTTDKKNTQLYEDAKTAIHEQAANARRKIAVDEANAQTEAIGSILGSASQGFDSLASIIENTSGKSSGAYVAMFAAAKAFAIAQSTLSLNTAIMQAMADPTALTPAQKMANYAAIASAGASLLSNIASVTMSGGRRYGGTVSAGNAYRINEDGRSEIFQTAGGQQAFIPNQSGKIIPANKVGGSGGVVNQTVHFTIKTTGGIDDATMAKMAQMMKQVSLSTIRDQQRPNGLLRRS
ncbi:tape measure protein [Enterobacter hormaechei]|uniref:tape measure protein n=2 Tax=Enterobacter hormaechei TaxID=158836 RepID=UPI0007982DE4|nr:tape measure protein [Enterobacter hormaechei]CZZ66283.1 Phage tail length tape-measure protein 1 [Enterobacter hormaechei]SAA69582.1 Phage tail length tape-measure protein 1 [Enterobacter hormaechei]SAB86999.1 Phage tail length tape-measure protein 1 [Enterobacter hormaechei]SAF89784.1 Phage tail length tape-measure protein 1 [Enterobacter hormaechei]